MSKMILELLSPLDSKEMISTSGQAVQILLLIPILPIAQIIRRILQLQTHIPADPPTLRLLLHMRPHAIDRIFMRLDPYISEHTVFGVEQLAETLEEEHMGG